MNKVILSTLIILIAASFIFAEDRAFNNNDLNKYKGTSNNDSSEDQKNINEPNYSQNSFIVKEDRVQELKHYAVPYSGSSRRIIIPVTFNNRVTAPMLLDTGAPGMHISYGLAEKLGIIDSRENELRVMIGGIGGTTPAILTIIDRIDVGEAGADFIPTLVSDSISPNFEGLVGMDFMTKYSVRIDTRKRVVIFEELPQYLNMPGGHDESWWRSTFYNFRSIKSAWAGYRKSIVKQSSYTAQQREVKTFVNRQYEKANELNNRLSGKFCAP
jgi:hypothetical protein